MGAASRVAIACARQGGARRDSACVVCGTSQSRLLEGSILQWVRPVTSSTPGIPDFVQGIRGVADQLLRTQMQGHRERG